MDPTPQAMPNMVKNERSLFAQMARKTCPKVSPTPCSIFLKYEFSAFKVPGWRKAREISAHPERKGQQAGSGNTGGSWLSPKCVLQPHFISLLLQAIIFQTIFNGIFTCHLHLSISDDHV